MTDNITRREAFYLGLALGMVTTLLLAAVVAVGYIV